jgi:hypothetical protein
MQGDSVRHRFLRLTTVVTATLLLCLAATVPAANAQAPGRHHLPNLVVLGDSFASGVGNVPYQDTNPCKRSDSAYGPLLARLHLVTLQAFVACSGARTDQVWGPGPNGETPPQIDAITKDTDVVTVQALGNDFFVGAIEALCFLPAPTLDCTLDTPFPANTPLSGQTVGSIVGSIALLAPGKLQLLYGKIDDKLGKKTKARVITVGYPNIVGNGGPFCPGVTTEETQIAAKMVADLNTAIKNASSDHGYRYAPVDALFRGHDACAGLLAVYPPLPPSFGFPASQDPSGGGALHPNRLGQSLYAAAVAKRLFW